MEDAFFDIRVFHANAPSNQSRTFQAACEHHERLKQLEYEERIVNVDRGSFCPLVFSTSGAIAPLCTRFLKRLAGKIAKYPVSVLAGTSQVDFEVDCPPPACLSTGRSFHHHGKGNGNFV